MDIEDMILRKVRNKNIALCVVIMFFSILISKMFNSWTHILLGILFCVFFGISHLLLLRHVDDGKVISVHAKCISHEQASSLVGVKSKKESNYRFVIESNKDPDEAIACDSIFIRAKNNRFMTGAVYCLLFDVADTSRMSESNLIDAAEITGDFGNVMVPDECAKDAESTDKDYLFEGEDEEDSGISFDEK